MIAVTASEARRVRYVVAEPGAERGGSERGEGRNAAAAPSA